MTTAVYAADRRFFEVSALDTSTLPPLPADLRGRHTRWVLIAGEPGVYYSPTGYADDAEWVDMDAAWMARAIEQHEALRAQGYTPPIRAQHAPGLARHGDVLQLATWSDPADGRLKLLAALAFADPDAPARIERGEYAWASMGVGGYIDEQGTEYSDAILEVSLVDAPYHKHLSGGRPGHILREAAQMADKPDKTDDAAPDMAALIASLAERMDAAEARLAAMEPGDDAESMDDDEADDAPPADGPSMSATESPDVVALRERIATLERDKARAEYRAAAPVGAQLTLTAEMVDALFALRCAAPEAHDTLARAFTLPATPAPAPTPPAPAQFSSLWGTRLGHSGGAPSEESEPATTPESVEARKAALYAEAKAAAGGDARKALATYRERCRAEGLVA